MHDYGVKWLNGAHPKHSLSSCSTVQLESFGVCLSVANLALLKILDVTNDAV